MQARTGTGIGPVQMLAQALSQALRRGAAALSQGWHRVVGDTTYRPEKHYMRGPGPKWRAKHAETEALRRHAPHGAAGSR
jgi:hypothetical protein